MRVLINTVPFYRKGAGVRTYTTQLLRAFHASHADMEWDVILRAEDAERLGLTNDSRFRFTPLSAVVRPPRIPGLRFAWWNALDHLAIPRACTPRKYDAIHYLDSYGSALHIPNVPLVLTVHDIMPLTAKDHHAGWVRNYLAGMMRRTIPRAFAVLADSDATALALEKVLAIPAERIKVSTLGVDERFHPPSAFERAEALRRYDITSPYILSVGTIEPRKNLLRLVRAFAQAKSQYGIPHHLLIAGSAKWKAEELIAAIAEVNLGSAIRLLGFVPDEDIAPLIGAADVLACPSLEEGFGLPVIEGMACGTPVLTSITSPLAKAVGQAALLVDPLDTEAMAVALGEVCMDSQRREAMGAEGLIRAQQYSWNHVADTAIETYRHAARRLV